MDVLKIYFKLFFKNTIIRYLYLCMMISTILILGVSICMGLTLAELLYILCMFIFFEMVLFMILSYIFLTRDKVSHVSETIEAIAKRETRQTYSIGVLGTLLIIFNFILMILMLVNFTNNDTLDLSDTYMMSFLLGIIIPEIIALIIVSYSHVKRKEETIDMLYDQGYVKYAIAVLSILLVIYNIVTIMLLFIGLMLNTGFIYFSNYYIVSYLMNIVLPEMICFMVVIMLSSFDNRFRSSIVMIIFLLLVSPLMNIIQSSMMNLLLFIPKYISPFHKVFQIITLPFSLFMTIGYNMDSLYSYNNEVYKLWLLLGWFIIFILVYYRYYWIKKKHILIIMGTVIGLCGFQIYRPQSTYRLLYDNDYTEDYNYYMSNNYDTTIYSYDSIDYAITSYDLDISVKEKLYVEGTLHLESDQAINTIILTLYHSYKVKNISSSHLTSYNQNGDYITLVFDSFINEEDIIISYSGYHNIMFSNYEAVQLPGYFAWYPMVGEKTIYFYNSDIATANDGLNPYNRIKEAKFNIHVNASYQVICNLDEVSTHTYSGMSDSLTLIGGYVGCIDNQIVNYYPIQLSKQYTLDDYQDNVYTKINNLKTKFEELFQIELTDFDHKNIIIASNALFRQSDIGYLSIFDNYILVSQDALNYMRTYINYKLYNRFDLNPVLIDILNYLDYETLTSDNFIDELISEINDIYSMSIDSTLEENIIMAQQCETLLNDFNHYIDTYGKEALEQELGKVILGGDYEISG